LRLALNFFEPASLTERPAKPIENRRSITLARFYRAALP